MGREIEKILAERGHEVVLVVDADNSAELNAANLARADVAIEFTAPQVALDNYRRAWAAGVPVVSGTTGWTAQLDQVKREVAEGGHTLFWSSNFSLGVNLFMMLSKYLAGLMNRYPQYDVTMTEVHHTHKLDAPSGTAITLAEGILEKLDRKTRWVKEQAAAPDELPIRSIREGEVPGIHTVRYESAVDSITITHDAKSREGFALGAVVAAEFTVGKKGFLGMEDLMQPPTP